MIDDEVMPDEAIGLIRRDVINTQKALNLSNAAVSKRSGIPPSTLSQFLSNKYKGDISKVATKARAWLESHHDSLEVRSKSKSEVDFVETGLSKRLLLVMRTCRATSDMGIIIGPPGMGKTITSKHFVENVPLSWHIEASPTTSSPTGLLRLMAEAMKLPNQSQSHAIKSHVRDRLTPDIPSSLIIDEAQHLNMKALEEIRSLHDQTGMSVVLMGNEEVAARISGPKASMFAQLSSRIGMRYTIPVKADKKDIGLLIDALEVEGERERSFLIDVGREKGALRQVDKVVRLARLTMPDEAFGDPMLPFLKKAARQLQVGGAAA